MALEAKDFFERLPGRLNQLLDIAASNKLKVKIDTLDERLTSLPCRKLPTGLRWTYSRSLARGRLPINAGGDRIPHLGYPGIAILFFFIATAGALAFAIQILRSAHIEK